MEEVYIKENELNWQTHPKSQTTQIKVLLSKQKQGAPVSCLLVSSKKGSEIPEHIHEESEDIIYPLSGKAKVEIAGYGVYDLVPGTLVRVPKNTKHRVFNVEEDLLAYDVFSPAIF